LSPPGHLSAASSASLTKTFQEREPTVKPDPKVIADAPLGRRPLAVALWSQSFLGTPLALVDQAALDVVIVVGARPVLSAALVLFAC